jgi:hypothetical protein
MRRAQDGAPGFRVEAAAYLGSGDGHAFDADGGGCAGASEDEVVAYGYDVSIHVLEVAGYGDLFDGVG